MPDSKAREDWLREHAQAHPEWQATIEKLIASNLLAAIPVERSNWKDAAETSALMILEPYIKGEPPAFRMKGETIVCINYPGSYPLMTIDQFLLYVAEVVAETDPEDDEETHSQ